MSEPTHMLEISPTSGHCAVGEAYGGRNIAEGKVPVLSCEGACIRGEIARRAANLVAKEAPYRRACHGELFAVPDSAMAHWVHEARQVVLIDGCFLRCHGRILERMVPAERLVQFDALSHYKRYTDRFDSDAVPEAEIDATARDVADWVLDGLRRQPTSA
jgi:uncharacterized metal-binding protein